MKIFIICSSSFYDRVLPIKEELEKRGHSIVLPNCFDNPNAEEEAWAQGFEAHAELDRKLFQQSEDIIKEVDAVLCLNYNKNGVENYIGGATFIELYEAFRNRKKIFLYHGIPNNILYDEIAGFNPTVINENLELIDSLSKKDQSGEQESSSGGLQRLNFWKFNPPKSVHVIPDSQMYDLERSIQKHLDYNEACRARGRVKAGEHRAGGSMPTD